MPRGEADGDGWLVGPFLDLERGASGLSVFDASHLADGPLWQGALPYPLPPRPARVLRGGVSRQRAGSAEERPSSTRPWFDAFTSQFWVMWPRMQLRSRIAREIGLRS